MNNSWQATMVKGRTQLVDPLPPETTRSTTDGKRWASSNGGWLPGVGYTWPSIPQLWGVGSRLAIHVTVSVTGHRHRRIVASGCRGSDGKQLHKLIAVIHNQLASWPERNPWIRRAAGHSARDLKLLFHVRLQTCCMN